MDVQTESQQEAAPAPTRDLLDQHPLTLVGWVFAALGAYLVAKAISFKTSVSTYVPGIDLYSPGE